MRWTLSITLCAVLAASGASHAGGPAPGRVIRCDGLATTELAIDGLLDDWPRAVQARAGTRGGAVALRCAWDGAALALSLDIEDERVVRVPGKARGHDDHVTIAVAAGGAPVALDLYPGNRLAKARLVRPARVAAADSLQPKGFSVEVRIPAARIAGLTPSTPSLALRVVFVDSDQAAGGDTRPVELAATIELADRKDLLDDFLRATRLAPRDVKLDTLVDLDPDRKGKERLVAGGTIIGVLTDQFAFVRLPAARAADVREVQLLPLGRGTHKVVAARVEQRGNGGSRELLMLWTVWSGQLQPLAQIEVKKQLGDHVLEATWKIVPGKGKRAPELWVQSGRAAGFSADTWNEAPAEDADPILLPWDTGKGGVAYALQGAELTRRDLPAPKRRR